MMICRKRFICINQWVLLILKNLNMYVFSGDLYMVLNKLLELGINGLLLTFYHSVLLIVRVIHPYLFSVVVLRLLICCYIYVDDIILTCSSVSLRKKVIQKLSSEFAMKILVPCLIFWVFRLLAPKITCSYVNKSMHRTF